MKNLIAVIVSVAVAIAIGAVTVSKVKASMNSHHNAVQASLLNISR